MKQPPGVAMVLVSTGLLVGRERAREWTKRNVERKVGMRERETDRDKES